MRILFWPAHAHLILTCVFASHFEQRVRISFWPAIADLIFACACTPHLDLRMRISFTLDHAHFILACACASFFGLHMGTSFWLARAHLIFDLRMHTSFRWYLIRTPHLNGISLAHLGRQSLLKWGHLIWPPVGPATLRTRKTLNDWTRGQLVSHTSLFQVATHT